MAEGNAHFDPEPSDPQGIHVTVGDVIDELGPIVDDHSSVFNTLSRNSTIARWIDTEREKLLGYMRVTADTILDAGTVFRVFAQDIVLMRVCARALRKVDANRLQAGLSSYRVAMEECRREASKMELWLGEMFNPSVRGRGDPGAKEYTAFLTPAQIIKDTLGITGRQDLERNVYVGIPNYLPGASTTGTGSFKKTA